MFSFSDRGREDFSTLALVLSTGVYLGIMRLTTTSCEDEEFQSRQDQLVMGLSLTNPTCILATL